MNHEYWANKVEEIKLKRFINSLSACKLESLVITALYISVTTLGFLVLHIIGVW